MLIRRARNWPIPSRRPPKTIPVSILAFPALVFHRLKPTLRHSISLDAETKGKNKAAKPEKEVSDEDDEENGSGDAAKKDTKNGANKKNEGPMALGEIAFIDSKITSTKIDGLQPLYNVSCRAIAQQPDRLNSLTLRTTLRSASIWRERPRR